MDGSARIKDFETLQEYINSAEFRQKQKMKPLTFKDTDEYRNSLNSKVLKKIRK
jgi:hypothetical protein